MPLDPPLPIFASYTIATNVLRVVFDHPLTPGATAAANWLGTIKIPATLSFAGLMPGVILGSELTVVCAPGGPGAGPAQVNYLAAPPDVANLEGTPAAAFAAFPLTMI